MTLVLGDVEGSTERWEASADDMRAAMRTLSAAVDQLVAAHDGARPVEQGEGDSFVAAFGRAADAVAFAEALQAVAPLPIRIGIHTGDVEVVDGGYAGPAIIRAARLRDAGHGGQVLLSQTTAALVIDDVALGDLGEHKLKGLNRPERIYQLPGEFPGLRLAGERGAMPAHLTAFVGRTLELAQLRDLVKEPGCVTITGAGGSGKTRIALELVAATRGWFVDLAAVEAEQGVDAAVAEAVGARVAGGRSLRDAIASTVSENHALLVLDNCEHLLPACSALAADLLSRCAELTILATSREPLGLAGEVTYRLPSLAEADAVTLFVERARRANPRAHLDASDVVVEICARLDGMPLAIELAAARMRVFTADQLLDALHDRFRLLTGGARTAMPRQRTLEASVDWSYTLLLEPERVLLRRLSVFAGGFTLDAAIAVAADGELLQEHHVFDLLVQLLEKSLVVADERAPGRFVMLETIRHYATARLVETGETESCRARHFRFFRRLAGGGGRAAVKSDSEHYERLSADEANIRRALQWSADQADGSLVMFAGALIDFWTQSGPRNRDGLEWTERALASVEDDASRAFLLCNKADLLGNSGRWAEGAALAEEGIALARVVGDPRVLLGCLLRGYPTISNTTGGKLELLDEATALSISLGNRRGLAAARMLLGFNVLRDLGDSERGVELLEEARALAQAEGLSRFEAMCEGWLGMARALTGGLVSAVPMMASAAEKLRLQQETFVCSNLLALLAPAKLAAGDEAGARAVLEELDGVATDVDDPATRLMQHVGHGLHAVFAGDWAGAIEQLRCIDEEVGSDGFLGPIFGFLCLAEAIQGHYDDAERHVARAENQSDPAGLGASLALMTRVILAREMGEFERAWELAFGFSSQPSFFRPGVVALLGQTTSLLGRPEEAVRLVAAAQAADAEAAWVGTESGLWAALVGETLPSARAALGDDRVDELWAEGSRLSIEDALAVVQRGRGPRQRPMLGWDSLTPTEADVARLVAQGLSNKEVAAQLFMSVATVKTHITRIYAKVGVTTRAQLSARAHAR